MPYPLYGSSSSGVTPPTEKPPTEVPPASRWLDRLLHALLPACCLGCDRPLPARGSRLGLCGPCRSALRPLPRPACAACARPLPAAGLPATWLCAACRDEPPAFDRLLAAWPYEPPVDAVIQALKFGRLDYLGRHLAEVLAASLGTDLVPCDLVVPVPLHWRRRLARGYNQAECIATPLAALLGRPCSAALRRRRATAPQTSLGREPRRKNLRGAFLVPRPGQVRGRRILLVDDVATTGATLEAAARVLRAAGATAVTAVVAARTPLQP